MKKNGTWLFSADLSSSKTHACLDAVRRHLGKKFELAGDDYKFIWIDEFPLFEYDEEEKKTLCQAPPVLDAIKKDLDVFMSGSIEEVKSLTAIVTMLFVMVTNFLVDRSEFMIQRFRRECLNS